MEERIDLGVLEEKPRRGGISLAVAISFILHAGLLILFIRSHRPMPQTAQNVPMARYVELIGQNPQEFTEAPGPAVESAPLTAPLSDANRKASGPNPTGTTPTNRPGDGGGLYTPPSNPLPRAPQQAAQQPQPAQQPMNAGADAPAPAEPQKIDTDRLVYHQPTQASAAAGTVDWNSAIKEVSKVASLGGDGMDLGQLVGGEKGTYEQGPISFETQWYDWGPYAQSMVSKIRVNWYANMPQIIRTGMSGHVTIRFTIQRDGRITDVTILKSSNVPPYDFAAKKAIELSSPLNPLPKDFPNPTERVTCLFYYNMEVPQ
ncbi:MAG TPA: cell envelope integrity protein TolA [Thermoanaerobaculia bacterium]|nr:cell envelope integrity protein TolA [Thermoanaerobaculia bacterium]